MSNKLCKYQKIHYYIRGDEQKLRNRFAFFCEWSRLNGMNYIRDRRKHTITFKYPKDKIYVIFTFLKDDEEAEAYLNALGAETAFMPLDICASPSLFVEAAVGEMQRILGVETEEK